MKKLQFTVLLFLGIILQSCTVIANQTEKNLEIIRTTIEDVNNLYNNMIYTDLYQWKENVENYKKVKTDIDQLLVYEKSTLKNADMIESVEIVDKKFSNYVSEHKKMNIINESQAVVYKAEMNFALQELLKSELKKPKKQ